MNGERLTVNGGAEWRPVYGLLFTVHALLSAVTVPLAGQIQDNSFLIEEAYNQERGVVQHISTFARPSEGGSWAYSFTQEWPLRGIRHQLSYTIPVQNDDAGTGLGDVALNYRHQLVGSPEAPVVLAPRFSLLLPTGDHELGRGAGALGLQTNLPLSVVLAPQVVSHWNAGVTVIPSAKGPLAEEATTTSYNLGASVIWLAAPSFNLMLEGVWLSTAAVAAGGTVREEALLLNPGVRVAVNLANGLQVVPGLAYTVDLSADSEGDGIFAYLSLEHAFKR